MLVSETTNKIHSQTVIYSVSSAHEKFDVWSRADLKFSLWLKQTLIQQAMSVVLLVETWNNGLGLFEIGIATLKESSDIVFKFLLSHKKASKPIVFGFLDEKLLDVLLYVLWIWLIKECS